MFKNFKKLGAQCRVHSEIKTGARCKCGGTILALITFIVYVIVQDDGRIRKVYLKVVEPDCIDPKAKWSSSSFRGQELVSFDAAAYINSVWGNKSLPPESLVFHHFGHTGGSAIRVIIENICKSRGLNCFSPNWCIPINHPPHSIDILYGHMPFEAEKIARIMKGRPLIVAVLRHPYETCRSGYFYQKRNDEVNQYMTSHRLRDVTAQEITGEHHHNWVYQAYTADPGCQAMMNHLRLYDITAPYEHYTDFLIEVQKQLPAAWKVLLNEMCTVQVNTIATKNEKVKALVKKFDESLTADSRAKFNKMFSCQRMAYDYSVASWHDIGNNLTSELETFRGMCAAKESS
eukprot:gnl/MRDRNA2_/MRDRNA2_166144_c0_seq1.p1 gnl/MRDRNA2_/MRDRNA2_166144_c0~~gnl/MRDRNA2_/MRDRNA2_166144_c0_seq1.p1  ORF type:complete len:346 (-),score=46.19 gnl/MRDRNA2_/MRDRNA2_166144_c0_seq1:112-1149(-)